MAVVWVCAWTLCRLSAWTLQPWAQRLPTRKRRSIKATTSVLSQGLGFVVYPARTWRVPMHDLLHGERAVCTWEPV